MERDCDTFPRHPFPRRTKCRVLTHALDVTRTATGMNREENREEKVVGEGLDMDV